MVVEVVIFMVLAEVAEVPEVDEPMTHAAALSMEEAVVVVETAVGTVEVGKELATEEME